MVEGRIYFERAAAGRGGDQGTWFILSGLSCQYDCRYRAFSNERHAARGLAQRRRLFRRELQCRERSDLLIPGSRSRRELGNCAKPFDQQIQPGENRQICGGAERRTLPSERVAVAAGYNHRTISATLIERRYRSFSPVNRSNASTYFADVFTITSCGNDGAGGVLSQSRVSR